MIGKALYSHLSTDVAIAAAVSTRIYPTKAPDGVTLPCIVYTKVSGPRVHSHDGFSKLAYPVYQVDVYAKKYTDADDIGDKVRKRLIGYSGTVSGIRINGILMLDEVHEYMDDVEIHRVSQDYRVWHEEEA